MAPTRSPVERDERLVRTEQINCGLLTVAFTEPVSPTTRSSS
jgi:hypothetical protein